jgi:Tetratricopeptide repeat
MIGHRQKSIASKLKSASQVVLSGLLLMASSGLSAVAQAIPTHTEPRQKQAQSRTPFCIEVYDAQVDRTGNIIYPSIYTTRIYQGRWAEILTLLQADLRQIAALNDANQKLLSLQLVPIFLAEAVQAESFDPALKSQALAIADITFDQFQFVDQVTSDIKLESLIRLALVYHALGNSEKANGVLGQASTVARTTMPLSNRVKALANLAAAYGTTGNRTQGIVRLDQATRFARRIRPTSEAPSAQDELFALIASKYAELGDIASALGLVQSLNQSSQDYAYTGMVSILIQQNRPNEMLALIPNITDPGQQATALLRLGEYQAQHNKLEQAKAHFEQALTIARLNQFSSLEAQVLASYGQWFPETTLPMAQALTHPQDIAIALLPIALHYGSTHPEGLGNQLMAQIFDQQAKMNPDELWMYYIFSFDKILQVGEYGWALQFGKNMSTTNTFGNLQEVALKSIANHALKTDNLEVAIQALSLFTRDFEVYETNRLLDTMIDYALAQGEPDQALRVQALFSSSSPVDALKALVKIARYLQPIDPARSTALFNSARQQLDTFSDPNETASGLVALSAAYFLTNQTEIANQTFNELLQIAKSSATFVDDRPFLEAKLYAQAFASAQAVTSTNFDFVPAPVIVIDTLFTQESFSQETATLAEPIITSAQNPEIKTNLWLKLADYRLDLGQPEQALAALQNATTAALTISDPEVRNDYRYPNGDSIDRASLLESIALYYAYLNQPQMASQVASKIQSADLRTSLQDKLACF